MRQMRQNLDVLIRTCHRSKLYPAFHHGTVYPTKLMLQARKKTAIAQSKFIWRSLAYSIILWGQLALQLRGCTSSKHYRWKKLVPYYRCCLRETYQPLRCCSQIVCRSKLKTFYPTILVLFYSHIDFISHIIICVCVKHYKLVAHTTFRFNLLSWYGSCFGSAQNSQCLTQFHRKLAIPILDGPVSRTTRLLCFAHIQSLFWNSGDQKPISNR